MKNMKFIITLLITITILTNYSCSVNKVNVRKWNIGFPDTTNVTAILKGNTLIIEGKGKTGNYPLYKTWYDSKNNITNVIIKKGITHIGSHAFYDCHQLKSISIPKGMVSIGEFAFKNCYQLEHVIIPNSVTIIKRNAFERCKSLKSIVIPNNVTRIEEYAFYECFNLNNILLGSSVSQLDEAAFRACHNLSAITIPKSTTKIGDIAFRECYNLTNINVEYENLNYSSINGVLFNKNQDTLIAYPNGKKGEYIIPESVSVIGGSAFARSKIDAVFIPNTVKIINGDAFRYCHNLKNITIPNSVTETGILSFANCDSLVSIMLGSGITDVNMYVVSQSNSLSDINIDANSLRFSSKNGVLYNKTQDTLIMYPRGKNGGFTVPPNVKCIKTGAFEGCQGLTEITISESVTRIEDLAFQYIRNLTKVTNMSIIPQPISDGAFSHVKLNTLSLFVPRSATDTYKNTPVWKEFGEIKVIE
jgi:hypothetical protein